MMKTKIITIVATAMLLMASSSASADIVELDLFDLGCPALYNFNSPSWTTDFGLGITFTHISHVYINWSGTIEGEETMHAGIIDTQFVAKLYELDPHDHFAQAYVQGGAATYPEPEPFELQSLFTSADWSPLLDGQSSVQIWFGDIIHPLASLGLPSGELDSATLVIEGDVVPEPATIFLLAIGIVGIRAKHSKR